MGKETSGAGRDEEEVNGVEAYDVRERVKRENGGDRWTEDDDVGG